MNHDRILRSFAAALAMSTLCAALPAQAQKVDAKGVCRGPNGKVAKMEFCAIMGEPVVKGCKDPKATVAKCGKSTPGRVH